MDIYTQINTLKKVTANLISQGPDDCKLFLLEAGITDPDSEMVGILLKECRRVKLQRNQYEEDLRLANREINRLRVELKMK